MKEIGFALYPVQPFRLDLTVRALRRCSHILCRWSRGIGQMSNGNILQVRFA